MPSIEKYQTEDKNAIMSYKSAIIGLCTLAIVALIPPLAWHSHTRNIPAIILITWLLIMNITCVVNAGVWGGKDFINRWDGRGWCDLVIKLQVGANVGISCAVTNITYNLHQIIRADTVLPDSTSWRKVCVDLAISLVTPIAVMGFSYLLQVFRYGIARYNGCQNLLTPTWVTTVLYTMWMLIWSAVGAVYACLVLYVFYKKRKDVRDILHCTNSGLNLTRFARLLTFCFIIILVMLPFSIFTFVQDLRQVKGGYNFTETHSRLFWDTIMKFDPGKPVYNVWLYALMAYIVFFIFGLGSDALNMYSRFLRFLGFGSTLDKMNHYIQRKKAENISSVMDGIKGNKESNSKDSAAPNLGEDSWSQKLTSPTSGNHISVDYSLHRSGAHHVPHLERFNPFDDSNDIDEFDDDLEMGSANNMAYFTESYSYGEKHLPRETNDIEMSLSNSQEPDESVFGFEKES